MGSVTALMMDVITEKSGHSVTPMAVSVCITPAAPSPLPIPYPVIAQAVEGITDAALRTKVTGSPVATVGSVLKTCHGNEPGTLKEVVSLNTAGPVFIIMGAPIVLCELGMMGITTSMCISNKAITVGANGTASGAGGGGGGGGGAGGGGGPAAGPGGPSGPSNGGGGGGGSNSGAGGSGSSAGGRSSGEAGPPGSSSGPPGQHQCQGGHPVDLVTGAVVDIATDLELPGIIPLAFTRQYASTGFRDRRSSLGAGWSHSFDQRVELVREGGHESFTFFASDGRRVYFEPIKVGERSFHRRERLTLVRDGEHDFRIEDLASRLTSTFRPLSPGGASYVHSTRDAYGNALEYGYEDGRLSAVRDTAGRVVVPRFRGQHLVRLEVQIGGVAEQWVDFEIDEQGLLVAVVNALGHADEYEYDGYGRLTAATTRAGARFQYAYDGDSGRCSRTWGPKGLYAIELEYDDEARQTRVYGEESRVIDWADLPGYARRESLLDGTMLEEVAYDADGYLIAKVNGAGEGEKAWYDHAGCEIRRVDALGGVFSVELDQRGFPQRRIEPDGNVTELAYNDHRALVRGKLPSGKELVFHYDDKGRLARVDDDGGVLRAYEYDAQHNVIAETDARGLRTTFAYDALGRAISQTDPIGRVTRVVRDRLGRPTEVRRPDGTTVQRAFDGTGRVTREIDPMGGVTDITWKGMGKVGKLIEPDGRSWSFDYTAQERIAKITNPLGESYSFVYDEAGNVVSTKTFDDRETKYSHDSAGRVVRVELADKSWRSYDYDREGNLLRDECSDGSVTELRRDARGRIVEATLSEKLADGAASKHVTLFERDRLGQILVERQGDRTLSLGYDLDGNTVERVLFEGSTTRWAFDRERNLTSVDHGGRSFGFERDAAGREVRRTDARGVFSVQHTFDALDRLVEQRVVGAGGADGVPDVIAERRYGRDRRGRVTRIDDALWSKTEYAYDRAGRLISASHDDHRQVFQYDPASSLVSALDKLAGAGGSKKWKLGAGNRLLETERFAFGYDKRGRRTSKRDKQTGLITDYVWDARDRLREVRLPDGRRVTMSYDAFGRRVRKEVHASDGQRPQVVELIWHHDQLCAELSRERGVRVFVHHPNGGAPLLHVEKGEVFHVVTDQVGKPRELIDGAGKVAWAARHDAWGRVVDERWDTQGEQNRGYRVRSPFRLLGQYEDEETGLGHTRYRAFDAEVGRWLSPDPLGVRGGMNLNGFDGAPTFEIDPLGLSTGGGNPHNHPPWTNPDGSIKWPPDRGFASVSDNTLQPGHQIDRYGGWNDEKGFHDKGTFVADSGTPYGQRALPAGTDQKPYKKYEVVKPLPVKTGPAAPWFGEPGGGTQHELPDSIDNLLASGHIKEVP